MCHFNLIVTATVRPDRASALPQSLMPFKHGAGLMRAPSCLRQGSTGFEVAQVVPGGRAGLLVVAGAATAVIGNSMLGSLLHV